MKVLVTGVKGQLGYDVVKELEKRKHNAIGIDVDEMDITDKKAVERVLADVNPDVVIHCAAYTAVDAAEDNIELCKKINVDGTENIAVMCKKIGCKMIYISTDYVFDGEGENAFEPDQETAPLNVYGLTKFQGEEVVKRYLEKYFIVRISWVFGINGNNFVKKVLQLGKERKEINVVNDQIGSPTYTFDLSKLLVDMIETEKYGVYHATNEGICSFYEFACEIFRQAGLEVKVNPVDSSVFPAKAKRPHNSRMSKDKLKENGFQPLPAWQEAVSHYLGELKKTER